MNANREIGGMEQRSSPGFDQARDSRQCVAPSGRPSYCGDAQLDQSLQVRDHRFGPGELDDDVSPRQPFARQRPPAGIVT